MKEFGVVKSIFKQNIKIVIKRVQKLQKLINEVQKKTKQNRKKQKV